MFIKFKFAAQVQVCDRNSIKCLVILEFLVFTNLQDRGHIIVIVYMAYQSIHRLENCFLSRSWAQKLDPLIDIIV